MSLADIFKAYDIRGVYGEDLTEAVVKKTAQAFALIMQREQPGQELTIVVGEDMRLSSPQLRDAAIEGLNMQGVNVMHVGLVSTPAFYFAVSKYGYNGGMMISASHNPGEYNGIKMVRPGALPVSGDKGIYEMRDMVMSEEAITPANQPGTVQKRDDIIEEHVKTGIELAGTAGIKPLKIVADAANSMGATYLKEMFAELPCELIEVNFELDGSFPSHEADPFKDENNELLVQRIKKEKADLGIATDGDGDRIFFIDNEGQMIDPAIIRGITAQLFLADNPGATICYDIRPGRITRDMIEEAGGKPVVTKVGHSLIKEQAIKEGAVFAGESSGHFFVKMDHGIFEAPVIVTLKLLQHWSKSDQSVADQIKPLRKYFHSGEINSVVDDTAATMQKIKDEFAPEAKDTSELDGITIEYEDYWFNVRASNTEPKLRLNLEARTAEIRDQKTEEVLKIIRG